MPIVSVNLSKKVYRIYDEWPAGSKSRRVSAAILYRFWNDENVGIKEGDLRQVPATGAWVRWDGAEWTGVEE